MNVIKCSNCGLLNYSGEVNCKRCNKVLIESTNVYTADYTLTTNTPLPFDIVSYNRQVGITCTLMGLACLCTQLYLVFVSKMISDRVLIITTIGGFPFIVSGLANTFWPPSTQIDSPGNKTRNTRLFLIGLVPAVMQAWFIYKQF